MLHADRSLLNLVNSMDGHNLVITAAHAKQPAMVVMLVERGAAWKYHGTAPHYRGHHLDWLAPVNPELVQLHALGQRSAAKDWTVAQQDDRIRLVAKILARLVVTSGLDDVATVLKHMPPVPTDNNMATILAALVSAHPRQVPPLRAARALMDLTLVAPVRSVLTMVEGSVVAASVRVVQHQLTNTRLGITSVLTMITLLRYLTCVLGRVCASLHCWLGLYG
jgi:hypothetical protein